MYATLQKSVIHYYVRVHPKQAETAKVDMIPSQIFLGLKLIVRENLLMVRGGEGGGGRKLAQHKMWVHD